MPTFSTPEPISVIVELGVGDLRIAASDRCDTVVEVRPSDPAKKSDVTAADNVRVEYADGRLSVKAAKGWRQYTLRGSGESIAVQINLPAGSEVRADSAGVAAFHCTGRLGSCRFTTGVGELQIEETEGSTRFKTGIGDITVGRAHGHVDATTGSGAVRIESIDGTAVVKNSNGSTWIGEIVGDLRASAANGKIVVDQARATVTAKTANGDVRLGDVANGAIVAETACGKIDIGIRDGVAAWLDLDTRFGNVHNDLDAVERPDSGDAMVEVRAHTSFGDVTVRHAHDHDPGERVAMTTTQPWALKVRGLRKSFGDKIVLDGIDLDVEEGTIFCLLGPNGAGKTTAIQILSTLLSADAGELHIAGFDVARRPDAVRAAIGVTGQFSAVDNLLTGEENLMLMADLHHLDRRDGRRRAGDLLDTFDLLDAAGQMVATYSGGMRRRLDLAMTLIGDPRIIFLDEPTTGLDPRSRRTMWRIIRELVADGVTIVLTTQNLEEADELANRIAVLDRGHLVAEGTPTELKRRIPGGHARLHFRDITELDTADRVFEEACRDNDALVLQVPTDDTPRSVMALLAEIERLELDVERFTVHTPDLDDVFFALTGNRKPEQESPS